MQAKATETGHENYKNLNMFENSGKAMFVPFLHYIGIRAILEAETSQLCREP